MFNEKRRKGGKVRRTYFGNLRSKFRCSCVLRFTWHLRVRPLGFVTPSLVMISLDQGLTKIGDPHPISIYWKLPLGSESFRTYTQLPNCPIANFPIAQSSVLRPYFHYNSNTPRVQKVETLDFGFG